MRSRFASKKFMETPGHSEHALVRCDVAAEGPGQPARHLKAMFVMGHGANTITRMPEAVRGIEKLDLLVVCDPYPTAWSVLSERKNGTYLLPACTSFEMDGSRTASNRSLQWGEQIVKPVFESKNDYDMMYHARPQARLCGPDVQEHQGRERRGIGGGHSARDQSRRLVDRLLRPVARAAQGAYANQAKFDLVTLRAPKDDPEVGGDYYGLPWPCWGNAGVQASRDRRSSTTPTPGEGGRRHVPRALRRRARVKRRCRNLLGGRARNLAEDFAEIKDGYPEFTLAC